MVETTTPPAFQAPEGAKLLEHIVVQEPVQHGQLADQMAKDVEQIVVGPTAAELETQAILQDPAWAQIQAQWQAQTRIQAAAEARVILEGQYGMGQMPAGPVSMQVHALEAGNIPVQGSVPIQALATAIASSHIQVPVLPAEARIIPVLDLQAPIQAYQTLPMGHGPPPKVAHNKRSAPETAINGNWAQIKRSGPRTKPEPKPTTLSTHDQFRAHSNYANLPPQIVPLPADPQYQSQAHAQAQVHLQAQAQAHAQAQVHLQAQAQAHMQAQEAARQAQMTPDSLEKFQQFEQWNANKAAELQKLLIPGAEDIPTISHMLRLKDEAINCIILHYRGGKGMKDKVPLFYSYAIFYIYRVVIARKWMPVYLSNLSIIANERLRQEFPEPMAIPTFPTLDEIVRDIEQLELGHPLLTRHMKAERAYHDLEMIIGETYNYLLLHQERFKLPPNALFFLNRFCIVYNTFGYNLKDTYQTTIIERLQRNLPQVPDKFFKNLSNSIRVTMESMLPIP
ncbi:hypothetical protein L3Y34_002326 [Caenorhabditis briggsae]|uniref:Uncharacterized protein n=1 Tax=Caenorhabditis briggsae TaxID=6238 RepID=A0AAE9DF40_CAEBR|nr:hypothetical protein L3Y34_002326 [Caenorhabditis briggsae]